MTKPDLTNPATIADLPARQAPYWIVLEYSRHLGVHRKPSGKSFWVARVRTISGGYRQRRLAPCKPSHDGVSYNDAIALAEAWFTDPAIERIASKPTPVGVNRTLKYEKSVEAFTIGDAMEDYVEWKRIAATRSHFETNLSLINFHIIPRLGNVPLDGFTGRRFAEFCREVLETPPKRGNQPVGPRMSLEHLGAEALRKRKKTLNTLIGILRLALRMAWENGDTDSERAWRCLRRIPSADVPRQVFLTRDQCRSLISNCRGDLADLVRGALFSGCRVSELQRMRVQDVGTHVFGIYIRPSKNGRGRYVILPEEGMNFFLSLIAGKPEDEFVFKMENGTVWNGGHKHLFREACNKAELPLELVFHGLRHTYASQLVQAGTPLAIVAKQLGHANTDTVSRTYGHLSYTSIETEIHRRFAPIERDAHQDRSRMDRLKRSLQGSPPPVKETLHWPISNFSMSRVGRYQQV
ncbi:tyrosine-type recombinase/integrase [Psychromarinibacter halotolerans]|uniref:tyrosine-type recombinase/integrase n=1 Tax=Psychromarinibacter halotolerans TaxID=1775175 RepID=UPI0036D30480